MFNINVRNTGTAAVDWKATINASEVTNFSKSVYVQYSLDGGATWSTQGSIGGSMSGKAIPSTSSLAAGDTTVIKLRAFLPENTDNTAQGKTVSFSLVVNAIQAGAPFPS
ncbi:hypothetical protein [Microbacterium sp. SORGH_AS_0421]|uniref:hypothetical protein n=1 Tax=Microbacterium sp. SORGH_AS_0421 TaxID=3041768 RepID=UPI00278D94F8|nr:hypothetical protein [Microbacterium sp. SORGH_AS_0421]MDQ1176186.1 hypothetical protein [Microbacterium sp. SORGH_AS_0421]